MIKRQLSDRLSNLGVLCVLGANPFRAGESTRAKLAKDAKVKGIKHDAFARVVAEWAFALYKKLNDQGTVIAFLKQDSRSPFPLPHFRPPRL